MKYKAKKIEKKWQEYWATNKTFVAKEDNKKDKFYALVEFPYPSGEGLHTGHLRSYTAMDVISRKKRLEGKNVLYPIGFDAFGLPTENYAIKNKIAPQKATAKNIANFTRQLSSAGFSFDWQRSFSTTDESYYKWTQWIFIQMFKNGLAYKAKENINWCTACKIGLANEEVVNGVCERCGGKVIKKEKEQWMLKITKYADRLISDLEKVDFLEQIKKQQIDWIGRSEGAELDFSLTASKEKIKVFTTRLDTLFGVTFMVISPEHKLISSIKEQITNLKEVEDYIRVSKGKSDLERTGAKEKTGVEIKGLKAINPMTNEAIPIFVADYVMMNYGTGAIMAVPAHDERDYAFAKKYNLEIREVILPLFRKNDGLDAFRNNEQIIERDAVVCIVKHFREDKYLCLQWKKVDWHGFVVGGIEKNESIEQAAKREVREETGYTNVKFIKKIGNIVHAQFYHTIKKQNRWARFQAVYLELQDDKNIGIIDEEKAIHDVKWLDKKMVSQFLNVPDMHIIWERLNNDIIYTAEGIAVNSGEFDGLTSAEFKKKIVAYLEKNKLGKKTVNYKLHDWIFSRQRYWGEPIPMLNCPKCGWVPENEKNLPIVLPKIKDYLPTDDGQSPLAKVKSWIDVKCPKCSGPAKRETDVMPNWAGSNWYFIRYGDPKNNKQLIDSKKAKYWLPVDWYNGGMEHTTLHLLYSRFVFKFLYDIGAVPKEVGSEPYKKRTAQGMILGAGGIKMSKSKGNVVNPDIYVKQYGADTVRVYEMFIGPFDQAIAWDDKGVNGVYRFLNRVWDLQNKVSGKDISMDTKVLLHKSIKKVSEDIDNMRFNTAVSQLMILFNHLDKEKQISKFVFENFILILSPFAPHIAEELWEKLGHRKSLANGPWPKHDEGLAKDSAVNIGIQVNGKIRDEINLPFDTEPGKDLEREILKRDKVKKHIDGKEVVKFIHIKNKIISIVIK